MIHVEQGVNQVYVYSTKPDLTDFSIKIVGKNIREIVEINETMTVLFFGNSFYQLEFNVPTLSQTEFVYEITAGTEIIDSGLLRYGNI